jgi:hypothetical protein
MIPNVRETPELDTIYAYDATGPAWSSNLISVHRWAWFSVSGSTPAAGDMMYFGGDDIFHSIAFNIDDADLQPNITVEYSQGGAAGNAISTTTHMLESSDFKAYNGGLLFQWEGASDWAKDTVNGDNKYWIRFNIVSGSFAALSYHDEWPVFQPSEPYVELSSASLKGDLPALIMSRLRRILPMNTTSYVSDIYIGLKSTGLDNFFSRFNAGGDNPTGVTTAYGTDTSAVADPLAPHGDKATITFATTQSFNSGNPRVKFTLSGTTFGDISDFYGTYRAFARAEQTAGSAEDVELRLDISARFSFIGEAVPMKGTSGLEIVDLGTVSLFPQRIVGSDEIRGFDNLGIRVDAKSNNGTTPSVDIHDLILIPIDELAIHLSTDDTDSLAVKWNYVEADSGVIRYPGALRGYYNFAFSGSGGGLGYAPLSSWQLLGEPPRIQPERKARLYFLFADHVNNADTLSNNEMGQILNLYPHQLYRALMGDELA